MLLSPEDVGAIFLRIDATDMRKGINGLAGLIQGELQFLGKRSLFVFTNRARKILRILYWDETGFAYWHKSLEHDKFKWPESSAKEVEISIQELRWLLNGIDISKIKPHKPTDPRSLY